MNSSLPSVNHVLSLCFMRTSLAVSHDPAATTDWASKIVRFGEGRFEEASLSATNTVFWSVPSGWHCVKLNTSLTIFDGVKFFVLNLNSHPGFQWSSKGSCGRLKKKQIGKRHSAKFEAKTGGKGKLHWRGRQSWVHWVVWQTISLLKSAVFQSTNNRNC